MVMENVTEITFRYVHNIYAKVHSTYWIVQNIYLIWIFCSSFSILFVDIFNILTKYYKNV